MSKRLLLVLLLLFLTACGAASATDVSPASQNLILSIETLPPVPAISTPAPEKVSTPESRVVDFSCPMVALTFDDGPHPEYTNQILDVMEEYGAVATFFEVGENLSSAPDAVRRAVDLGCEVGSHSYRHADLGKMGEAAIREDLAAADAAFMEVLGSAPTLLRPPYGSMNKTLKATSGRALITWSIDTEDWLSRDANKVVAHVQGFNNLDGQVILLHSIYASSVEATRVLVPWLQEQGYQLVTISELIELRFSDQVEPNRLYGYGYFQNVPKLVSSVEEPSAA